MLQLDGGLIKRPLWNNITTYLTTQLSSWVPYSERLKRGGPWCLLKLRQWVLKEYKWKGSFLGRLVGRFVPVQKIFIYHALAAVGPVQDIFFLPVLYFFNLSPSSSKLGRQSCRVACLVMCFSDCITPLSARAVLLNSYCGIQRLVEAPTTVCQFLNSLTTSPFSGCKGYKS
jgi:hypothetical protein